MAATSVGNATYYNMLQVHPLLKDNKFNMPSHNLFRQNVLIEDAIVQQANEMMGHQGAYGTYAGTGGEIVKVGGFRSMSTIGWGSFKDDISIFSDASAVPKDLVDIQGTAWLAEEQASKANYLGQSIENHLLYGTNGPTPDTYTSNDGTSTTPTATAEKYTGMAARHRIPDASDPLNPTGTGAQKCVYDGGGSGTDTTSMWFVRWGKRAVSLITPMNDPQYGLRDEDLGIQLQTVASASTSAPSSYRRCYMREYEWKHGLSIYPGENQGNHVARLRNIETSLTYDNSGLKSTIYQIIRECFNSDTEGLRIYVPPRLMTIFDILFESKQNMQFSLENPYQLSPDQWAGKIFIRQSRAISIGETAVAAV